MISFQVKTVKDNLKLERAAAPKSESLTLDDDDLWTDFPGGKCGSAFIDTAFKRWLREAIGVEKHINQLRSGIEYVYRASHLPE